MGPRLSWTEPANVPNPSISSSQACSPYFNLRRAPVRPRLDLHCTWMHPSIVVQTEPAPLTSYRSYKPEHLTWIPSDDYTAIHQDQVYWDVNYLPDILYHLRPGPEHAKSSEIPAKADFLIFGKSLNAYVVLPNQISSQVEGWRLEAWFRLDRRITAQDIIDRVNPKYELTAAMIESRRRCFRELFHVADWESEASIEKVSQLLIESGLDPSSNSTRGLTPGLVSNRPGETQRIRIFVPRNLHPQETFTIFGSRPMKKCLLDEISRDFGPCEVKANPRPYDDLREVIVTPMFWTPPEKKWTLQPTENPEPPDVELSELAYHGGPPARVFHDEQRGMDEDDTFGGEMTLEEYLKNQQISLEEFLCGDSEGDEDYRVRQERPSRVPVTKDIPDPWDILRVPFTMDD